MNWTEQIYIVDQAGQVADTHYDNFFWNKKGKKKTKKTEEEKAAAKEKRKAFWGNLGKGVKDAGGVQGILGTASNVISFFKGESQASGEYDYEMNMGHPEDNPQNTVQKQGISTGVWIVGGIVVLAVGGYLYSQSQKNKAIQMAAAAK